MNLTELLKEAAATIREYALSQDSVEKTASETAYYLDIKELEELADAK